MTIKELIIAEIDNIPEDKLDEVYQLIKEFSERNYSHQKNSIQLSANNPELEKAMAIYREGSQKFSHALKELAK